MDRGQDSGLGGRGIILAGQGTERKESQPNAQNRQVSGTAGIIPRACLFDTGSAYLRWENQLRDLAGLQFLKTFVSREKFSHHKG